MENLMTQYAQLHDSQPMKDAIDTLNEMGVTNPHSWNGKGLAGDWLVTLRIDGVRAIWHDERGWLSRADKELHNIPPWREGQPRDCEVFVNTFRDTIRATRTRCPNAGTPSIAQEHLYGLARVDPRLRWGGLTNPSPAEILAQLQRANDLGYEGLVLRQGDHWVKVNPLLSRCRHSGRL
jgi:hypothetical protein